MGKERDGRVQERRRKGCQSRRLRSQKSMHTLGGKAKSCGWEKVQLLIFNKMFKIPSSKPNPRKCLAELGGRAGQDTNQFS